VGGADQCTDIMGEAGDLLSAQVDVGTAARGKTPALPFHKVAKLAELGEIFGKDQVVDARNVLDLALRDDHDTGIIL
jgi:hypothetical protein